MEGVEEWRECPRFPGLSASSLGRVKLPSGKVASGGRERDGSLRAQWTANGRRFSQFQHGLIADAFLGPRPDRYEVWHVDGDKSNNRPHNLRYLSRAENNKATAAAGRAMHGEKHVDAKLSEADAKFILEHYTPGGKRGPVAHPFGIKALTRRFGVTPETIYRLVRGETWAHLITERVAMNARLHRESDGRAVGAPGRHSVESPIHDTLGKDLGTALTSVERRERGLFPETSGTFVRPILAEKLGERWHGDVFKALVAALQSAQISVANERVGRYGPDLYTTCETPKLFEIKTDAEPASVQQGGRTTVHLRKNSRPRAPKNSGAS